MAQIEARVREWVLRAIAVDGDTGEQVEYLSIQIPHGPRSWSEAAQVRVPGRPPEQVMTEVEVHTSDLVESTEEEGRPGGRFRIRAFRSGSPAGSKTFRYGSSESPQEEPVGTVRDEAAAALREMRLALADSTGQLTRMSSAGYQLAAEALRENRELHKMVAALTFTGEGGSWDKLVEQVAPVLPQLVAAVAMKLASPSGEG